MDDDEQSDEGGLGIDPDRLESALQNLQTVDGLPLTEPLEAGLGPLLSRLGDQEGGILASGRARWVLKLIGDRYSVSAGPKEISAHALIFERSIRWKDVQSVRTAGVSYMVGRHIVGKLLDVGVGRFVRIPGLRWLARRISATMVDFLTRRAVRPQEDSTVLVASVQGDGTSVDFDGLLGLVVLLSRGFNDAVLWEAEARDIPMVREDLAQAGG
jgi:hypothetical protein